MAGDEENGTYKKTTHRSGSFMKKNECRLFEVGYLAKVLVAVVKIFVICDLFRLLTYIGEYAAIDVEDMTVHSITCV